MCLQRHPVSVDNQLGQHRVRVVNDYADAKIEKFAKLLKPVQKGAQVEFFFI